MAAHRIKLWLDSRSAARVVQVVAVIALILSVVIGVRQLQMTQCQADYAKASNASQRARAQASELDRKAQDQLFQAIADDPTNAIASVRRYNAARALADQQRAKNPVPPPPSTACG